MSSSQVLQFHPPMTPSKHLRSSFTLSLLDDTPALFRPVSSIDKDRLQDGLEMLSPESRYLRFFSPVTRLSEEELRFFTEVDQINHVAWGAIHPDNPDFPGLGIARFVRLPESPSVAEAAVTVMDNYQRKGLGTILVCLLYLLARDLGVEVLRGTILPQNRFLIDWLHSLGGTTEYHEGAILVDVPVHANTDPHPDDAPLARKFKETLKMVERVLYE
ncbi:MAG: GNAT family N-acetyltransferase [Anaerolineales bacterium]|nr:GNAT family N-acetyltransferase [Anaerolineales bacterium]